MRVYLCIIFSQTVYRSVYIKFNRSLHTQYTTSSSSQACARVRPRFVFILLLLLGITIIIYDYILLSYIINGTVCYKPESNKTFKIRHRRRLRCRRRHRILNMVVKK
jgi:hypothetical protein